MSNKKAKYKSHFQEVWLRQPKYTNWLKKDKNDGTLAFCNVSWKWFSVAAHGKKALVLHASRDFHKLILPTSSQTTVKFVKDKPEEKQTIPQNENRTSTSSFSPSFSSIKEYSGICLKRTPLVQRNLFALGRCPLYGEFS